MHGWAAGFFDGEGCIQINTSLSINVAQVTPSPLETLVALYGGKIATSPRSNPRHRTVYRWSVHGSDAAEALTMMLPYLQVKAEEARLGMMFQRIKSYGRRYRLSPAEQQQVERIKREVREAKWHSYDRRGHIVAQDVRESRGA